MDIQGLNRLYSYANTAQKILSQEIGIETVMIDDRTGEEVVHKLNEYDAVKDQLAGMKNVLISERKFQLPGFTRFVQQGIITGAIAQFKAKEKKPVMPLYFAKSDHLVLSALRPGHFGLPSFSKKVSVDANKFTAIDNLFPTAADTTYEVPDDQMLIITDFIDFAPESPVTAIQVKDADGHSYQPVEVRKELRLSDLHIVELDYPIIAESTLDIDILVEREGADATSAEDVTHQLTPFGVWMGLGKDIPKLKTEL
jgi:hypothetical protein